MFLHFAGVLASKKPPKITLKRSLAAIKSESKNDSLSDFDFFTFWAPFGEGLGIQNGSKITPEGYFDKGDCSFFAFGKATCFPRGVLEGSRLNFGASRVDFGASRPQF